jgi:hypothetical protein
MTSRIATTLFLIVASLCSDLIEAKGLRRAPTNKKNNTINNVNPQGRDCNLLNSEDALDLLNNPRLQDLHAEIVHYETDSYLYDDYAVLTQQPDTLAFQSLDATTEPTTIVPDYFRLWRFNPRGQCPD